MKLNRLNIAALSLGILLAGCNQQPASDRSSNSGSGPESKLDQVKVKVKRFGYDSRNGWYAGNSNLDILIRDDQIWLKSGSENRSQARINAEGDLVIDEKQIPLDAEQRKMTQRYFKQAVRINAQANASGDAGVALLRNAIGNVTDAFMKRGLDQFGKTIEADSNSLETSLATLCELIAAIKDTQDSIVAATPAFKPFATIGHSGECT